MKSTAEQLGLESWLDLYRELVQKGLHTEQRIALDYPAEPEEPSDADNLEIPKALKKPKDVIVEVSYIRSMAFLDLFEQLPSKDAIKVIIDLLMESCTEFSTVFAFLKKIPTK